MMAIEIIHIRMLEDRISRLKKIPWLGMKKMEQFCLNIQKDVIQAIKVPFSEAPRRLKRELAIRLYEKGLISFGKARELSEMTRWAFHDLLGEEGILRRYDVEELEEDLKTLEELD